MTTGIPSGSSETLGDRFRRAFQKFRETGAGEAIGRVIEFTALRKDGTAFPVEIAVNPILRIPRIVPF
jgi:hypothetical protein